MREKPNPMEKADCNGKSYMQWEKPNAMEKKTYKRKMKFTKCNLK